MTAMTVAADALARLDDGLGRPGDREIAAVLDRHLQWDAFIPPTYCIHGQGDGCNSCFLDHDDAMRRTEDI